MWITAVSPHEATCQHLQFSYGVHAVPVADRPANWNAFAKTWLRDNGILGDMVLLTEGPSPENPRANNRLEIIDLTSL